MRAHTHRAKERQRNFFPYLLLTFTGVAFSSGLAATGSILHLLKSGDHIISGDDIYGGTGRYFNRIAAPTYDFSFSYVDLTTPENFDSNCTEKTKVVQSYIRMLTYLKSFSGWKHQRIPH